eukprot:SAG31_NODE_142_length_22669_cov_18.630040_10_plen_106_part_00
MNIDLHSSYVLVVLGFSVLNQSHNTRSSIFLANSDKVVAKTDWCLVAARCIFFAREIKMYGVGTNIECHGKNRRAEQRSFCKHTGLGWKRSRAFLTGKARCRQNL